MLRVSSALVSRTLPRLHALPTAVGAGRLASQNLRMQSTATSEQDGVQKAEEQVKQWIKENPIFVASKRYVLYYTKKRENRIIL